MSILGRKCLYLNTDLLWKKFYDMYNKIKVFLLTKELKMQTNLSVDCKVTYMEEFSIVKKDKKNNCTLQKEIFYTDYISAQILTINFKKKSTDEEVVIHFYPAPQENILFEDEYKELKRKIKKKCGSGTYQCLHDSKNVDEIVKHYIDFYRKDGFANTQENKLIKTYTHKYVNRVWS